ncbi:MAG: helix-turn-helix domain-containing protein [Prevotella sp.]|nr:helix-turn-helix domain-containing protein [Prevotella sp.]
MVRRILTLVAILLTAVLYTTAQTGHFIPANRLSSSLIADLCQDRQGSIWIATDYGLNRFDGYHVQTFLHSESDSTTIGVNAVVSLLCDSDGNLWVGTNQGLDRFDPNTESFVHYRFPDGRRPRVSSLLQLSDGSVLIGTAGYGAFTVTADSKPHPYAPGNGYSFFSYTFEDSKHRVWHSGFDEQLIMHDGKKESKFVSTSGNPMAFFELDDEILVVCNHGFMSYRNGQLVPAAIDMSAIAGRDVIFDDAHSDGKGNIYIGTRGSGLFRVVTKPQQRRLERVDVSAFGVDLRTAKVASSYIDHRGNVWLACHRKGLVIIPNTPVKFANWSFEGQGIRLGSTISSVCEGDGGMTWCTVQGVGVYGFDSQGHVVAHPQAPNAAEFIFRDSQQRFWLGTDDGLFAYNPVTGASQQRVTFDCDRFNDMTSDDEGNIYISTFSRGFCVFNPATGALRNYRMTAPRDPKRGRLNNDWIMAMSPDSKGNLWLATSSGVACFDPKADSFRSLGFDVLLDGVMCYALCETSRRDILIGTEKGLYVYYVAKKELKPFPNSDAIRDKIIYYVVEDNDGDIWCSTSNGIWQYDVRQLKFFGHINGNGLNTKEYIGNVGMHTDDNRIFFGHNDGLVVFSPTDLKQEDDTQLAPIQLTGFRVGDQFVKCNTEINGVHVTDGRPVEDCTYFTLSYLDHTVTMSFSQFDFTNPTNVTFSYKINDGQWIHGVAGINEFTLGHLQPGTYRVDVRAQQWGKYTPEKTFVITVRPPWYRSTLAYFFYFALLAVIGTYVFMAYRRRTSEQLNEEKMKFLINATHDIRSPLTLIMSPLSNLRRRLSDEQKEARRDLDTIERNAQRILNLVNQILDVRKIDKQQMHLHCEKTDLVGFVASISKMFDYNAEERGIKYEFLHDGLDKLDVWVDRGQFDKVIVNLLSNAFKYTADGGTISLRLSTADQQARLEVCDTGSGIDSEGLKHIFDRFYQGGNSRRLHIDGTGIGLNLCKMIVDMHHGEITAANRSDGVQGSVFTVTLPLGNAHLQSEEIEQPQPEADVAQENVAAAPAANLLRTSGGMRRVLIVDDDEEISRYIATELSHYYKFGICHNGREGLKELLSPEQNDVPYDLVISDVMMPEMDGFTMLRMIKTNLNLSHIPVIMLTSKADVGNRLEGLERGADAFLAKPFNMEELRMNIENLIHSRLHLKGKYSGAQKQAELLETPEVKGNDELLMERIMKSVNKNLSDSDFNVEMLCQEVGISRAQLHRKMKEMTGISTSEFIRNIRLEQAARLLREQKINVTQVAYTVGFSNLAHFSTIFRKHFGVAPSEYAEREK